MGGAERALVRLSVAQRAAGLDVAVVSLKGQGAAAAGLEAARIPVVALGRSGAGVWRTPCAALRLGGVVDQRRPDIIHAWLASACAAVKLVAPARIPRVYAARVADPPAPWLAALLGSGHAAHHRFVAVSQATAAAWARALNMDRSAFTVVGNGVERIEPWQPEPHGARPVFVGRLAAQKGAGDLLDALEGSGVGLDVVGDGPLGAALRARARGRPVAFHGTVQDVAPRLLAASMLVLPTRAEGMSNAVLEAMACGRAVVATAVPGMDEVITPGVEGVLVTPGNIPALRHAVLALQNDPARRQRMGRAGQARVVQAFLHDRVVHATWAVYRSLLGAR